MQTDEDLCDRPGWNNYLKIPKRTFFYRGTGNDCSAISIGIANFVLLPEHFEKRLDREKSQAKLLHEFAHGKYADFINVSWLLSLVGFSVFLSTAAATDLIRTF